MSLDLLASNKNNYNKKATLKLEWIFGIKKDIWPNVFILDLETIVYPASHHIVIYNHTKRLPLNQQQTFIQGSQFSKGFTNIAIWNLNKKYIVAAEDHQEGCIINAYLISSNFGIHNYPTKIIPFAVQDMKLRINKVYHMAFSQREKGNTYFASTVLLESPCLIIWKWDINDDNKEKESNIYPLNIPSEAEHNNLHYNSSNQVVKFFQISFSIFKNENFCLVSNNFIQYYHITEKMPVVVKSYSEFRSEILNYCWMIDGEFCVTTYDQILIFSVLNMEVVFEIDNFNENIPRQIVNQIHSNDNFFVCFGNNKLLKIFNKTEHGYKLEFENIVDLDSKENKENKDFNYDFQCVVFSNYENSVHSANNAQLNNEEDSTQNKLSQYETYTYFATTTNNDLIKLSVKLSLSNGTYSINTQYVISSFHHDSIEGMDICISKPYVVTVSKDKSLRLWNYLDRTMMQCKYYDEEMYSIAYHPSGMHALVSFAEKIRPLNIYYDDITFMTQTGIQAKKAKDVKFSSGGQFFAFDSQLKIEIWDFLNMHLLNNGQQTSRSKINSISFKMDDEALLICCNDALYEWKIGDLPQRHQQLKTNNFNNAWYIPNTKNEVIASIDDGTLKKISELSNTVGIESKFDYNFSNLFVFKFSRYLLGAVVNSDNINPLSNTKENQGFMYNIGGNQNTGVNKSINSQVSVHANLKLINPLTIEREYSTTTCLKLFHDINYLSSSNSNEPLIPAHSGDTTRIRVNYDENLVFSSGKDGCLNIYSITDAGNEFDEARVSMITDRAAEKYTSVVLIKKSKLKDLEMDKINQPEKLEELLKNKRTHNIERRETLQKRLDTIKNKIASTKRAAQDDLINKKSELEKKIEDSSKNLSELNSRLINEYERCKNDFQIQLTEMQRKVEVRREQLRKDKENFKKKMADFKRRHYEDIETITVEKEKEVLALEKHQKELDEEISILKEKMKVDVNATIWLNNKIIANIEDNISELKRGIENLKNYHKQQENKLKEKKEKQNQDLDVLEKEITQIKEQKQYQMRRREQLIDQKKSHEITVNSIKTEIKKLEKEIKEKKVWNSNLEKCKYVLDYQIKELKKETGPLDKTIDELKKHTKGLERRLNKYSREHDIINNKLVNFDDLKQKIKELKYEQEKEEKDIKWFKYKLHQCKEDIGNEEFIKNVFNELCTKYISDYDPPKKDQELKSEFENQKANMLKNAKDLSDNLKIMKIKHSKEIEDSRLQNTMLIKKIDKLKEDIKKKKQEKSKEAADSKHLSSIAAIEAQNNLKFLEEVEYTTKDEKIEILDRELAKRKAILEKKKEEMLILEEEEDEEESEEEFSYND